jgi:hypothetical protein
MMQGIASNGASAVRTTVTVDDELVEQALALADPGMPRAALYREALQAFIRQQSVRRLADLVGAAPEMVDVPRRRSDSDTNHPPTDPTVRSAA